MPRTGKDRRLLTIPGHEPLLDDRGWGSGWAGPGTITVGCTCDWRGLTIHERWFTPGENEAQSFAEPYRTFVAQYGADVMLRGDNEAYGTHEDAIRLYLDHIGYDPDADSKRVLGEVAIATDMLRTTLGTPALTPTKQMRDVASIGSSVTDALADLNAAIGRAEMWHTAPLLSAAIPDPEGRRLVEDYQQAQRDAAAERRALEEELLDEVLRY